ncbi:MAG TPA: TIGR02281 family clan AA aspartic protease [Stellaceae bacterium]|nr:TIGR02281 family clan AA aspartic protease [Stellaceae bacterium]
MEWHGEAERTRQPPQGGGGTLRLAFAMLAVCAVSAVAVGVLLRRDGPAPVEMMRTEAPAAPASPANELVYRADSRGHFYLDAEVNGTPVHFLVDTGATVVALSPQDARAIGLGPGDLNFSVAMSTANGTARAAPLRLRSLRLGQLEVEDVPAVVMEQPMGVSLLGLSFLNRLEGYSIRDGRLTLDW